MDVALPDRRAPGKVATQLPVAHIGVGGKVCLERAVIRAVVFKVCHERALAPEELGFGNPATMRLSLLPARYGAHFAVPIWQVGCHLAPGGKNGLGTVDRIGEVRARAHPLA